jgi:hypothetical protein
MQLLILTVFVLLLFIKSRKGDFATNGEFSHLNLLELLRYEVLRSMVRKKEKFNTEELK